MSIDVIIHRLIGQGEQGDKSPSLSPGASYALSQRLRGLVDADADGGAAPDRGQAEEALRLAAYLDGTMPAPVRAVYERELAQSPQRREELMSAAAWLDEIEAKREHPPAELTALALKLDDARAPERKRSGFVAFVERLFPGPRLALATSAIASLAILAVGADITLRLNPQYMPSQYNTSDPSRPVAHQPDGRPLVDSSTRNPDDRTMMYPRETLLEIVITPQLREALDAFRREPSVQNQHRVLQALMQAGLTADNARRIMVIMVNPAVYEALGGADAAIRITARVTPEGALMVERK